MKNLRVFVLILFVALVCVASYTSFGSSAVEPTAGVPASERVYVGGFPIGISLDIGGLLIDGVTGVETEYGTARVDGLHRGDIIKKINGVEIKTVDDVSGNLTFDATTVELLRDGKTETVEVRPLKEAYSGKPKLGVRIKDKIYGVGTVTFVRQNGGYAALGHEIFDGETDTHIPFCSGRIHDCRILGVKKGRNGEAGALLGSLLQETERGTVECNNRFGIAGKYSESITNGELVEIMPREEVKPGRAKLRTTIDDQPELFDIEIIKASRRQGRNEKSIVFRVVDKRLLSKTGGVVRGMSGSPILQNGKLVGAVTHVFLNDFTKGYAIYADCLNVT